MDKFVLDNAVWKTLYLVFKMCRTLYNNYSFYPCNALSIKPQMTSKQSSQIMHNSLSWSLSVCFLYNILYNSEFPGLGELVPESNIDES